MFLCVGGGRAVGVRRRRRRRAKKTNKHRVSSARAKAKPTPHANTPTNAPDLFEREHVGPAERRRRGGAAHGERVGKAGAVKAGDARDDARSKGREAVEVVLLAHHLFQIQQVGAVVGGEWGGGVGRRVFVERGARRQNEGVRQACARARKRQPTQQHAQKKTRSSLSLSLSLTRRRRRALHLERRAPAGGRAVVRACCTGACELARTQLQQCAHGIDFRHAKQSASVNHNSPTADARLALAQHRALLHRCVCLRCVGVRRACFHARDHKRAARGRRTRLVRARRAAWEQWSLAPAARVRGCARLGASRAFGGVRPSAWQPAHLAERRSMM